MARVPGLTPMTEDSNPQQGRVNRRVEVDPRGGVEIPALRPAAAPINTYARPPQPVKDDRLARLADALGALNTGLQQFGSAYVANQKKEMSEEEATAVAGLTRAETAQRIANKTISAHSNPVVVAGVAKANINALYQEDARAIHESLKTFDFENGNVDSAVTEKLTTRYQQLLEMYGRGPADAYLKQMNSYRNVLIDFGEKRRNEIWTEKDEGTVINTASTVLTKAELEGWDPEKTAKALNDEINTTISTTAYRTITPEIVNDTLIEHLKDTVRDNPKASEAILKFLDMDRGTGANGQPLGPISSVKKYADAVAGIRQGAQTNIQAMNEVAIRNKVAREDATALAAGKLNFNSELTDLTVDVGFGKTIKIPRDERLKAASATTFDTLIPEFQRTREQKLKFEGKPEDEAKRRAAEEAIDQGLIVSQRSGVLDPRLKRRFDDFAPMLTTANATDPVAREELLSTFRAYARMNETTPGLARSYINDGKTNEVLRDAWILHKVLRKPEGEALFTAQRALNPLAGDAEKELNVRYQELNTALDTVFSNPQNRWFSWFRGGGVSSADAVNYMQIKGEFDNIARSLVKSGLHPTAAITATQAYMQDPKVSGFININGSLMRAPRNMDPTRFQQGADLLMENYIEKEGKTLGLGKDDLAVRDLGNGSYDLVYKGTSTTVERVKGMAPATFTTRDVENALTAKQALDDEKKIKEQKTRNERKANPPTLILRP